MPKTYFNIANVTSLNSIPKNGAIHVIGVSGVAMAQLAVELAKKGYAVSGSDKEFYEPMGSLLKSSPVKLCTGYAAENVPAKVDLVVIGNAISYGNPEVDVVEQKNLPYTCFPQILEETLIAGKHSIVVTGTHGKSTTTALVASMLAKLDADPSYFVGGIAQDLPMSLYVGKGKFSVVEGDEYDSAFFAKVPKFTFYKPDTCIVNAIEYDHADIYPDIESIVKEFRALVNNLPASGTALCCIDFPHVKTLVDEWRKSAKCKIITFGFLEGSDVRITERTQEGFKQNVTAVGKEIGTLKFTIPIPGAYNAKNALVTLLTAKLCGFDLEKAKTALSTFKAVKRRQEIRYNKGGVVLVEDFAHHPTAVDETIAGIREAFPDKTLWAIFEPRSNTSRRKVFQEPYIKAFNKADRAILCQVAARAIDTNIELIDVPTLSRQIKEAGVESVCLDNAQEIEKHLMQSVGTNDVILVMSNGSFGGLPQALETGLRARHG